ncbi:RNA polymerase sigma factor [Aquisphaera giovannonii]|nr:winged helix-turn-helix transcriptional regulator [Aquisphaera giovannonii]
MSRMMKVRAGGGRGVRDDFIPLVAALADRSLPPDGPALRSLLREIARVADRSLERSGLRGRADASGEDVANAVLFDLHRAAAAGRLRIGDVDALAGLVWGMVKAEVLRIRQRTHSRSRGGRGRSAGVSGIAGGDMPSNVARPAHQLVELEDLTDRLVDGLPTPEQLACAREIEARFAGLFADDAWREIARGRLQGLTNDEIARRTGQSVSTVRRRLRSGLDAFEAVQRTPTMPGGGE